MCIQNIRICICHIINIEISHWLHKSLGAQCVQDVDWTPSRSFGMAMALKAQAVISMRIGYQIQLEVGPQAALDCTASG